MKRYPILIFLLIALGPATVFGQTDTTQTDSSPVQVTIHDDEITIQEDSTKKQQDTTRIKLGNTRIIITENKDEEEKENKRSDWGMGSWSGFDLGVNGLFDERRSLDLSDEAPFLDIDYGKSRKFTINFYQHHFRLIGSAVGLSTGLGVEWFNFKLKSDDVLNFQSDSIFGFDPADGRGVLKNKLRVSYLTVPLLLDINTSPDPGKSFHISAGVIGKLRIGNAYKQRYRLAGETYKEKTKGHLQTNPVQLDATVRIGYGWFTLFGTAGILPIFQNDENPELYSWSTGIAFRIYE